MTDPDDSGTFFIVKLRDTVSSDEVNLTLDVCIQAPINCQESTYPPVYLYKSVLYLHSVHSCMKYIFNIVYCSAVKVLMYP